MEALKVIQRSKSVTLGPSVSKATYDGCADLDLIQMTKTVYKILLHYTSKAKKSIRLGMRFSVRNVHRNELLNKTLEMVKEESFIVVQTQQ